jgi:nucleoside 2-deoxyribosyltransferase
MNPKDFLLTAATQVTQSHLWGDSFRDVDQEVDGYALTHEAMGKLDEDRDRISKLRIQIVEARLRGEKRNIVIFDKLAPDVDPNFNWTVSIDEFLNAYPSSPAEMFDRALINISRLIKRPGDRIHLDGVRESLLYGGTRPQDLWMLRQLEKFGYISRNDDGGMSRLPSFTIESGGWRHIGELQRKPNRSSVEAFVAMNFEEKMRPFFEDGIRPAVEADGKTKCVRIDGVQHNNKICDEIVAALRRSRYVVADFTGNRGGVYYEAGFAHGLGIPVIWTVRESAKDLHFDTRQYNHIVYNTADELRQMLRDRIAATIG